MSDLTAALTPADEPKESECWERWTRVRVLLAVGIVLFTVGLAIGPSMGRSSDPLTGEPPSTNEQFQEAQQKQQVAVVAFCFLPIVPGAAIAFLVAQYAIILPKRPAHKAEFVARHAAWTKAKAKWDRCYYCYRHNVVFVPGEEATASPEQMQSFLHG